MITKDQIRIRDPFILTDFDSKNYYLYGTTDENVWEGQAIGFDAYKSRDLVIWEGPFSVFRPEPNFWANQHYWAPEVYFYQDRYYMFASFKGAGRCRGTQILVSNHPLGPFSPLTEQPITPSEWECLDGTLFIDDNQDPWIIYCHEWLQVQDGEICAQRLTHDFLSTVGEPCFLFKASSANWAVPVRGEKEYITDGPFLYQDQKGRLQMLWSSRSRKGYAVGIAISESGNIRGPWVQEKKPLVDEDGGHAMLFRTFHGEIKLAIHSPNRSPNERPVFLSVFEQGGKLVVQK
jgi:arabinan endo-1,5-alpha-L-arabinosidase